MCLRELPNGLLQGEIRLDDAEDLMLNRLREADGIGAGWLILNGCDDAENSRASSIFCPGAQEAQENFFCDTTQSLAAPETVRVPSRPSVFYN